VGFLGGFFWVGFFIANLAFRAATLARTIGIFRRNLETALHLDESTSWDRLREEVRRQALNV
jgi:hypothetical protein